MLYAIKTAASQFFLRAVTGKNGGRDPSQVDDDYQRAAHLAAWHYPTDTRGCSREARRRLACA
jgi:hypothetical protein